MLIGYGQVESVLEDFEKKTAALEDRDAVCTHLYFLAIANLVPQVEEQRQYLGGDKDHTILVKGLDFALLEQNKARAMLSHEDDDSLEAAFQETQLKPTVPRKRTRDDLLRELKEKRTSGSTDEAPAGDKAFEDAKKIGKFRPIGASDHSIGYETGSGMKGKERDKAEGGAKKKKRRKVGQNLATAVDTYHDKTPRPQTSVPTSSEVSTSSALQEADTPIPGALHNPGFQVLEPSLPTEPSEKVDIFSDAGEYEGVDFGEDEDEDEEQPTGIVDAEERKRVVSAPVSDSLAAVKGWFIEDEPPSITGSITGPSVALPSIPPTIEPVTVEPEMSEPDQVTRLAPLASSALPSISDFLAMDAQAEEEQKRKVRKDKKKGGEKKEKQKIEVKVDRDYKKSVQPRIIVLLKMALICFQRLNAYLSKKGDSSKGI